MTKAELEQRVVELEDRIGNLEEAMRLSVQHSPPEPQRVARRTLPVAGFEMTDETRHVLTGEGYGPHLDAHVAYFEDYLKSCGKKYTDFQRAFRNCVRSDWGGLRKQRANGTAPARLRQPEPKAPEAPRASRTTVDRELARAKAVVGLRDKPVMREYQQGRLSKVSPLDVDFGALDDAQSATGKQPG